MKMHRLPSWHDWTLPSITSRILKMTNIKNSKRVTFSALFSIFLIVVMNFFSSNAVAEPTSTDAAKGVVVVEGIWPSEAFIGNEGINTLVGSDPVPPNGGAAFHDTSVWIKAYSKNMN